jgi:hypothetical protein
MSTGKQRARQEACFPPSNQPKRNACFLPVFKERGLRRRCSMKNLWPGCRGSSANSSPSGRLIHILAGLTHIPA